MREKVDVVYVVASQLGSIGMGTTAYNAVKGIDCDGELSFNVFCRGCDSSKVRLRKGSVKSYGYLEYLTYPFRFLEKKMGIRTFNYFGYINNLFGKSVERNLPDCKIYHTWMGLAPEAVLKAKKSGAILVLEAANSHPLNSLKISNAEYDKFGKSEFVTDPEKIKDMVEMIKLFDYVMCPSDFVYDSFVEQGFSKSQLIKMPYGVDIEKFKPYKKKNGKFRAVFVGSLQLRKGIQYLLKAWDELKLKDAELIIVGSVYPEVQEVVNKYRGNSSIKFIGFDKNPSKYLKGADVFISPSLEEGSALTCYEAMASGLPLIATYNTGSVMRNGKDGLMVLAGDVKDLKDKISRLYNNPSERKRMGENARKRVEEFSWNRYWERLIEFYKKVLRQ